MQIYPIERGLDDRFHIEATVSSSQQMFYSQGDWIPYLFGGEEEVIHRPIMKSHGGKKPFRMATRRDSACRFQELSRTGQNRFPAGKLGDQGERGGEERDRAQGALDDCLLGNTEDGGNVTVTVNDRQ